MGWKGTLRSWNAANKRLTREVERQNRLRQKEEKQIQKLHDLLKAQEEVNEYQEYIQKIQTIHKYTFHSTDWRQVLNTPSPVKPIKLTKNEKQAKENYQNFCPNLLHKLFKKTEKIKSELAKQIESAKQLDEKIFKEALSKFEQDYAFWVQNISKAKKVLAFEQVTLQSILNEAELLEKFPELGSDLAFEMKDNNQLYVDIFLHNQNIIPKESKSLLKSGKISIKNLPKSKYHELHQDYVCSVVLRVAREIFGLIPVDKIIITAIDELLDKSTGHLEVSPILSVLFIRDTLNKLNFKTLDPSDSMNNFLHNMSFKKTTGFNVVEKMFF